MLKSDEKSLVSKELVQQIEETNKVLDKCCDLAQQQRLPNKQIAIMTDARIAAAGFAVLIEDDPLVRNLPYSASHTHRFPTVQKPLPQPKSRCPFMQLRTSCDILRIKKNWACFLGSTDTAHYPD